MRRLLGFLRPQGDGWLLLAYAGLCLLGLALLWSVTEQLRGPYENVDPGVPKSVFYKQVIWILAGWLVLRFAAQVPLRYLEELSPLIYISVVLLLVGVLLLAPEVMGARRWFVLGPLKIQPAEMAKIAMILVLARLLSGFRPARWRVLPAVTALGVIIVPALLVLREPDLGTALVFPAIWLGMVVWQGTSWVFLLAVVAPVISAVISFYSEAVVEQAWPWGLYLLLLIGVLYLGRFRFVESLVLLLGNIATGLGIPLIWTWLKPYQQERILSFFDPARDVQGAGYQVFQSKVAIGAGGFFGTHYLQGTQKGLAFLPERHTDFIFSVIGEELGFVGAVALLGLFLVLILRGIAIAHAARRAFASFVAIGCVCVLAFHVIVNVSITTGLLPVTGLPLPLISYGGSHVLTTSVLLGLLVNIDARAYES